MKRVRAYVTGSSPLPYRIVLPEGLPRSVRAEFVELERMPFTRFRAAQALANAVNSYAKTVQS